jgi:hypothetical protein
MCRSGSVLVALALEILAAACSDNTTPDQGEFTVSPATAWAGSEVEVTAHGLSGAVAMPVVRAGDSTLAVRPVSDYVWAVRLPATAGGSVALAMDIAGQNVTLPPITVRGFTAARAFATHFTWDLLVWPRTGDASVLGGDDNGNLVRVNVTSGELTKFDSLFDNRLMRGPGVTTDDSTFLLRPRLSTAVEAWTLYPTPVRVARYPTFTFTRQMMQFGPDAFLLSRSYQFEVTAPAGNYSEPAGETSGVFMSPTHDRATIRVNLDRDGVPVFHVATGAVAYRLADLQNAVGADFSSDGQLLAVAGGTAYAETADRAVLVRASDGTVLHDTTFSSVVWGIALDRSRPLVYVGIDIPAPDAGGRATRPAVVVLDRDTFAQLGVLAAPATAPACILSGCYGGVLAVSSEPAVYAVWSWQSAPLQAWRFGTAD